jgi:hypothetical protein
MRSTLGFVGLASIVLATGCTRSPAPPSVSRDGMPLSVFTDTTLYRRHCEVPAGRPVNLETPCLLLDQGRQPVRRPAAIIP